MGLIVKKKHGRPLYDPSFSSWVKSQLSNGPDPSHYGAGRRDGIEDRIERIEEAFALLAETLVEKRLLTAQELFSVIVGYDADNYEAVEEKE